MDFSAGGSIRLDIRQTDDGGFKRSAHSAVPNWMFAGFERPNSSENRAKIELGGQMEDQDGPKMATRAENAGQYDPKLGPTGPNGAPSGLKMVRGTSTMRQVD